MYVRQVNIENIGPIHHLALNFQLNNDQSPKPTVFVGQNGSGKSILLSHFVNAILSMKNAFFEDIEIEKGKVYKLRSPSYIRHGSNYSFAKVQFSNFLYQSELQLSTLKKDFIQKFGIEPDNELWSKMDSAESSILDENFGTEKHFAREVFHRCVFLYFPPNRFEEPAWLNELNLLNTAKYTSLIKYRGYSNKTVINYAPLKDNQDFLLDLLYDSFALERRVRKVQISPDGQTLPVLDNPSGPATILRSEIEKFLKVLLDFEGPITWSTGARGNRSIAISSNGAPLISNLFALSTGQTSLLNIFLTIIRQSDVCNPRPASLSDIEGIVIVDEIDAHLHTDLQYKTLPKLIELFPKVQFLVTSHSPLFALGLSRKLTDSAFEIIALPNGDRIGSERYIEFLTAYEHFKNTSHVSDDIAKSVAETHKPVLFVEGDIDISLISHAAKVLGRPLDRWRVLDGQGYGGLDKIWKHFDSRLALGLSQSVLLLYDCDVRRSNEDRGNLRRRVLPTRPHKIRTGVENLFPDSLIERAFAENPQFVDHTPTVKRTRRGVIVEDEEKWAVNLDEKRNLADWIIANSSAEDFSDFAGIFDMLEEIDS